MGFFSWFKSDEEVKKEVKHIKAPKPTALLRKKKRPDAPKVWDGSSKYVYLAVTPACEQLNYRGEVGKNDNPDQFARQMLKHGLKGVFSSEDLGNKLTPRSHPRLFTELQANSYGWMLF